MSIDWPFPDIAPRWNHAICGLWGLASPTECVFEVFEHCGLCSYFSPRCHGQVSSSHSTQLVPRKSPACQLTGLESPSPWPLAGQNKQRPGKGCWLSQGHSDRARLELHASAHPSRLLCLSMHHWTKGINGSAQPWGQKTDSSDAHMETVRQGASWGLMGMARLLNYPIRGPTRLSHAGLGRAGQGSWPRQA